MNPNEKACTICGENRLYGITIGLGFICDDCEQEMVHTDVKDSKYTMFVEKMRMMWIKQKAQF